MTLDVKECRRRCDSGVVMCDYALIFGEVDTASCVAKRRY